MALTECHLRYLLTIFRLGKENPDVGVTELSKVLGVKKPTVTSMLNILMEKGLLVRERFSKVYLTDTGFLLAKDLDRKAELLREKLVTLGLDFSEEELSSIAWMMTEMLKDHDLEWFSGKGGGDHDG